MQKLSLFVLTSMLLLSSCASSSTHSSFGGYTLDYLGNMEPDFVTSTVAPVEHGKTFMSDSKISTGVWHCSAASWTWPSYPVHEIIELLDGEIVMTWKDGKESATVRQGDLFFVPKGAALSWENKGDVLKKYFVVDELPSTLVNLPDAPHSIFDPGIIDVVQRDYFAPIQATETTR